MSNESSEPTCAGYQGCHELEGVMYDLFVHDPACPKSQADAQREPEVSVAGRRLLVSLDEFERRCLTLIAEEQAKISPENALIDVLCNAVRLRREYVDAVMADTCSRPTVAEDGDGWLWNQLLECVEFIRNDAAHDTALRLVAALRTPTPKPPVEAAEKQLIGCINTAANNVWSYADQYSGVMVADYLHKMVVDAFKSMTHAFDHVTAPTPSNRPTVEAAEAVKIIEAKRDGWQAELDQTPEEHHTAQIHLLGHVDAAKELLVAFAAAPAPSAAENCADCGHPLNRSASRYCFICYQVQKELAADIRRQAFDEAAAIAESLRPIVTPSCDPNNVSDLTDYAIKKVIAALIAARDAAPIPSKISGDEAKGWTTTTD